MRINLFVTVLLTVFLASTPSEKGELTDGKFAPIPNISLYDLRTESLVNPLGLDQLHPRFSWKIKSDSRGFSQTNYQIVVASSKALLDSNTGDLWDSGRVSSFQQSAIAFSGKPLDPSTCYYWKARVSDQHDHLSPWNSVATFETGLLEPDQWKAHWIGGNGFTLLRHEFDVSKPVARARVYLSACGLFELHLNGQKVGPNTLEPIQANPKMRLLYVTYDCTSNLVQGRNAVGAMIGGGAFERLYPNSIHSFLLQMRIEYTDGTAQTIVTDESWKGTKESPVTFNDLYVGENEEAQKESIGWDRSNFNDSQWESVPIQNNPVRLVAQTYSIKQVEEISPTGLHQIKPGVWIFDLGKIISGRAQLTVAGPAGKSVALRYGEILNADGTLNTHTTGRENKTTYTLRGSGMETWAPRFFTTSFRFVEVTGFPGTPTMDAVKGLRISSDLPLVGTFDCSDDVANGIERMYVNSQSDNFSMGIPTDCPGRERLGWLGDAMLTAEAACDHWELLPLYEKWFNDFDDDALRYGIHGSFHSLIPWPDSWGGGDRDVPWSSATISIPWTLYQVSGDRSILENHYAEMKQVIKNMGTVSKNNLVAANAWGDWVSPDGKNNCDPAFLSSAYYFRCLTLLCQIANVLGLNEDASRYTSQAEAVKAAINSKWLLQGDRYDTGSQTANAIALDFDLVPVPLQSAVVKSLVGSITAANNHLRTGVLGTFSLLRALHRYGLDQLAFKVVTQISPPSWGYMLQRGATAPWEKWDYREGSGDSHNHVFLAGPPVAWEFRVLAGISPLEPGYRKILIAPVLVSGLTWVNASIETVPGTVSVRWSRQKGCTSMTVVVPPNTAAEIDVPTAGGSADQVSISENGQIVWPSEASSNDPGLQVIGSTLDSVKFLAASGSFHFLIAPRPIASLSH